MSLASLCADKGLLKEGLCLCWPLSAAASLVSQPEEEEDAEEGVDVKASEGGSSSWGSPFDGEPAAQPLAALPAPLFTLGAAGGALGGVRCWQELLGRLTGLAGYPKL